MDEPTLTVRIQGQDRLGPVDVECVVPAARLPRLMAAMFVEPGRALDGVAPEVPATAGEDLVDFYRRLQPKGFAELMLVAGRFLQLREGRQRFTRADLRRVIKSAPQLPWPRNFNRDFAVALHKGYLRDAGDGQHFDIGAAGMAWLSH